MRTYEVQTRASSVALPVESQLAWRIAEVAVDPVDVEPDVADMIANRLIDNAAVAVASLSRRAPANARAQAAAHPYSPGATVFGLSVSQRFSPEWAAWANGVAVRELDFHDTFLSREYSHPGDNIPPILAVAQHTGRRGADVVRAIATGYEIQVDLSRGICLHEHKIDHVAHLGPSVAAGIGTLLDLDPSVIFHAINHSLHVTTATRQSRKGQISSWKAYAPAFAGKAAVEAVDRAMRGETGPSPIYEGEDGFIAWMLGGPQATYRVTLPERGEAKRAILDTYTKEHSAEYQAQALIDLARRLRTRIADLTTVESIVILTSHHTHHVIGSGAGDPQKMDPEASRETLDHSLMYIFAVALEDGKWHHDDSYSPERSHRSSTVQLWGKIRTVENPEWTRRYHSLDEGEKAFGGRVIVTLVDGTVLSDEIAVADAHPLGARPFAREEYVDKFRQLSHHVVSRGEQDRFLDLATHVNELSADEVAQLTVQVPVRALGDVVGPRGIFS